MGLKVQDSIIHDSISMEFQKDGQTDAALTLLHFQLEVKFATSDIHSIMKLILIEDIFTRMLLVENICCLKHATLSHDVTGTFPMVGRHNKG